MEDLFNLFCAAACKYPSNTAVIFDRARGHSGHSVSNNTKEGEGDVDLSHMGLDFVNKTSFQLIHELTYHEVKTKAEKIGSILKHHRRRGEMVGYLSTTNVFTPTCILGVLSSGCGFVFCSDIKPTDLLINRLGISCFLVSSTVLKDFRCHMPHGYESLVEKHSVLDDCDLVLVTVKHGLQEICLPGVAYVVTTSGTTGEPKVVLVPHTCIIPNITELSQILRVTSNDLVFWASPLTFDPSMVELFVTLVTGACLLIVPPHMKAMPGKLAVMLSHRHQVSVLMVTPTLMYRFGDTLLKQTLFRPSSRLRVLALGGEQCPPTSVLKKWTTNHQVELYNLYGITEVSCWASCHCIIPEELDDQVDIPLGEPLQSTVFDVRTEGSEESIKTGTGLLYIGSRERTCYIDEENSHGSTMVMRSTGDIVSIHGNQITYEGRLDDQVKRNGQRINLKRLEQTVLGAPCDQSAAFFLNDKLILVICGCEENVARQHIKQQLERAYNPDHVMVIGDIPITSHGKVDKVALNQLVESRLEQQTYYPRFKSLSLLWMNVLQSSSPPCADSRFIEYGGDSFMAVQLSDLLERHYGLYTGRVLDLVLNSTFGDLSKFLDGIKSKDSLKTDETLVTTEAIDMDGVPAECNTKGGHSMDRLEDGHRRLANSLDESVFRVSESVATGDHNVHEPDYMDSEDLGKKGQYLKSLCDDEVSVKRHKSSADTQLELFSLRRTGLVSRHDITKSSSQCHSCCYASTKHRTSGDASTKHRTSGDASTKHRTSGDASTKHRTSGDASTKHRTTGDASTKHRTSGDASTKHRTSGDASTKHRTSGDASTKHRTSGDASTKHRTTGDASTKHRTSGEEGRQGDGSFKSNQTEKIEITISGGQFKEMWRCDTGKCVDASPLVVNCGCCGHSTVCIGSHSHTFSAVDLDTGHLLWTTQLPDRIESSACLTACGQYVVVGCYDGCVYFMSLGSGDIYWSFQTGTAVKSSPIADSHSGLVFVGSHDHSVYALDVKKKCKCWSQHLSHGSVFSSPCISYRPYHLYVATLGGTLNALHPVSGVIVWTYNIGKPLFSSPATSNTGVIIGCVNKFVYSINHQGHLMWKLETGGAIFSSPFLTSDNRVIIGTHDCFLYCIQSGGALWRTQLDSEIYSSICCIQPVINQRYNHLVTHSTSKTVANVNIEYKDPQDNSVSSSTRQCDTEKDRLLCVTTKQGCLYLISEDTGQIVTSQTLPGEVFSSPVTLGNQIIIGCRNNFVYCLEYSNDSHL